MSVPGAPRPTAEDLERYPPPDPTTAVGYTSAVGRDATVGPTAVHTSGMAITAMILGMLWIYWIGSILAVILGHISLTRIERSNGWLRGRGIAIAALVFGYLGLGLLIVAIVIVAADSTG